MELKDYQQTIKDRLHTCKGCPSMKTYTGIGMVCGTLMRPTENTCGCILMIKTKIPAMKCPQNKW